MTAITFTIQVKVNYSADRRADDNWLQSGCRRFILAIPNSICLAYHEFLSMNQHGILQCGASRS